jgi:SAM-dependent methyltransferase
MSIKDWIDPVINFQQVRRGIREYVRYVRDWRRYERMPHAEPLLRQNAYPCLFDRTSITPIDSHYFYQDIWAFKLIQRFGAPDHVDVGSRAIYVGMLSAITHVTFIDVRPLRVSLDNFESQRGSVLEMPFESDSVASLSCLHVAEHIGLGRYGDPLDPEGTKKAARELVRVLASGGHLYFSLPIGKPRVQFNAHRVHSPQQILDYFRGLDLVDFAAVNEGEFYPLANPEDFAQATYACGLFHFTKRRPL